ncbi:MAG: peptidase [Firmicutes bacterium]|nr:peptidase [Bacillota bacterium]
MSSKVVLVFSAVLWHELAHAQVALMLRFKVQEVELLPFGGVARIEGLGVARSRDEIMIAAAGPAASLVLAAIAYTGMLYAGKYCDIWEFYYKANMMLTVFNLLPGLPLDGGRILRAWLALYMDYSKATLFAAGISKGVSVCLLIMIVYEYIVSSTMNVTFLIAAVFLYTTAKSEIKVAGFRTLRVLAQKKAELIARGVMTTTYFTVVNSVILKDVVKLFKTDQYYVLLIVNTECKICGTLTETEIWEELPSKGFYAEVGEFIL